MRADTHLFEVHVLMCFHLCEPIIINISDKRLFRTWKKHSHHNQNICWSNTFDLFTFYFPFSSLPNPSLVSCSIQFHCLLPLPPPWRPHKASLKQKTTKQQQLLLLLFSQTIQNKKESKLCTNYFQFGVGHENHL